MFLNTNEMTNDDKWLRVYIITVAFLSFAIGWIILMTTFIIDHQRKSSQNSETAIHVDARKDHMSGRKMVIYVNYFISSFLMSFGVRLLINL